MSDTIKDVGIVLGGGLKPDGSLPQHVKKRVNNAQKYTSVLHAVLFSSRYTLNKRPVVDNAGFIIYEAKAMSDYFLSTSDYCPKKVFLELCSTDTIGSALFCRMQMAMMGWRPKRLLVFTSAWHGARAEEIFSWAFSLGDEEAVEVELHASQSSNTAERISRELASVEQFRSEYSVLESLDEVWRWFYQNHTNYNTQAKSISKVNHNMNY